MRKVGFFKSIRLKFILIYILLLLLAIQVIGAYFVQQLETQLLSNFKESINDRIQLLSYNLEQSFSVQRKEEGPTLQSDVQQILFDFDSEDITDLQVIDNKSRVIGTTNPLDQRIVGKRTTEYRIKRTLLFGTKYKNVLLNRRNGNRTLVMTVPLYQDSEVTGAIYLEASLEGVYDQLQSINKIFANGTFLAVSISALLGVLIARTITKPITEMRKKADAMAKGDFSKKVNVYGHDEIGQLAFSFNDLNDKLKQAQANTEGERRKLSTVLSNMSDGVIATDRTGGIILMNEPASRLVGKSFEEVKGKSLLEVLEISQKVVDISEIHETGSIIIDLSRNNQQLLLRANFSVIQDENEEMNGFITVLSDVTEQEKIERDRREFVQNVSHELRTPLTTMRSYLEALMDGDTWKDEEITPKFLGVTQNETERMIRLVNDLLQLSKMDNKDYKMHKEQIDFPAYLHQIMDRFEMNKKADLHLFRHIPEQELHVYIDKDKLTQVLDNIISNAIKYSPEGGTITLGVEVKNDHLKVHVTDQGVGIPKEQLKKVFERFYRVDKARSRKLGGTGLGLAIAKEIIEAHNGKVWAESEEGKGTTILFTLPLLNPKRGDVS